MCASGHQNNRSVEEGGKVAEGKKEMNNKRGRLTGRIRVSQKKNKREIRMSSANKKVEIPCSYIHYTYYNYT